MGSVFLCGSRSSRRSVDRVIADVASRAPPRGVHFLQAGICCVGQVLKPSVLASASRSVRTASYVFAHSSRVRTPAFCPVFSRCCSSLVLSRIDSLSSRFLKSTDPSHPPKFVVDKYEDPVRTDVLPEDSETFWIGKCCGCASSCYCYRLCRCDISLLRTCEGCVVYHPLPKR